MSKDLGFLKWDEKCKGRTEMKRCWGEGENEEDGRDN